MNPVSLKDPYMDREYTATRLYTEYKLHGKLIVAVDYDDTIFDFHKKGYAYPKVIELLLECQKLGFYICIFTGSPLDKYQSIRDYIKSLGINIASINENPFPLPFGNNGKMYYNILLDDRAGLRESYDILLDVVKRIKD